MTMMKRTDLLESQQNWLSRAEHIAKSSPDPSTQVGAVLMTTKDVKYTGYNHFVPGINPRTATREARYGAVIHAEESVLFQAGQQAARGADLFQTHEPCGKCWRFIVHAGIARVFYLQTSPDRRERWECDFGRWLAVENSLELIEVVG